MGMGLLGGAEVNGAVLGRAHVGAYRMKIPVPAGICGKNSRKLAQEIAAENNKKCDEKCGMMQNLPGIRGIICRKLRIWAKSRNLLHRISTPE